MKEYIVLKKKTYNFSVNRGNNVLPPIKIMLETSKQMWTWIARSKIGTDTYTNKLYLLYSIGWRYGWHACTARTIHSASPAWFIPTNMQSCKVEISTATVSSLLWIALYVLIIALFLANIEVTKNGRSEIQQAEEKPMSIWSSRSI